MAHGTLIGGTAYEVSGGRTLVGGTGYDISKGRTLVGGTGYDVSFVKIVPVTLTSSSGNYSMATAKINGVTYDSPLSTAKNLEVVAGDTIVFSVSSYRYAEEVMTAWIKIDGTTVASTRSSTTYNWIVPDCSSIKIELVRMANGYGGEAGWLTVTTT